jgi:hypothetical protein
MAFADFQAPTNHDWIKAKFSSRTSTIDFAAPTRHNRQVALPLTRSITASTFGNLTFLCDAEEVRVQTVASIISHIVGELRLDSRPHLSTVVHLGKASTNNWKCECLCDS